MAASLADLRVVVWVALLVDSKVATKAASLAD